MRGPIVKVVIVGDPIAKDPFVNIPNTPIIPNIPKIPNVPKIPKIPL